MNLIFTALETERLTLDEMRLDDAQDVLNIRSNPVVLTYLGRDPMKDVEEARSWIQNGLNSMIEQTGINWAIREKNQNRLIGLIGFWKVLKERNRAEIGYSLHPDFHRLGYMSEAIQQVLEYGFDTLKFHSVQAEIDPFNDPSRGLLEKMNFKKEAHFTENYLYKDEYTDSAIYSLLERWFRPK